MKALRLGLLVFILAGVASAGSIIDFIGGSIDPNLGDETYGYSFTVTGTVTINGMGVFESFARSLGSAHPVGLWDSGGTLLASASIGGADPVVVSTDSLGQWRAVNIAPVTLSAGQYFTGVFYLAGTENVLLGATPASIAGITYNSAQYAFGPSLAFPGNSFGNTLVGPALFAGAAPEPATAGMFAMALAGISFLRFRKSRR
jgi:hypothetical protein